MHLLLTAGGVFLWVVPNVIRWDSPGAALLVSLVGWAAIFAIYFGVRKFIFRDSTQAIWMPLRFLIGWPFLLLRLPWNLMRRTEPDSLPGCIWHTLRVTLFVIVVIAWAFVVYLLIMHVGYFLIAASIGIGVAEGITYLKKTDAEFDDLYLERGRCWF